MFDLSNTPIIYFACDDEDEDEEIPKEEEGRKLEEGGPAKTWREK